MKISNPICEVVGDTARLESRISFAESRQAFPNTLWFELPRKFAHYFYTGVEGLIAGLLPLAMYLEEDIHVESPISPKFAFHLQRYHNAYHRWQPNKFKKIEIGYEGYLGPEAMPSPRIPAMAFSGGADSLHALWRQLPENEGIPEYQAGIALFIKFGLEHHPEGNYELSRRRFEKALIPLGITLLALHTNLRHFNPLSSASGKSKWIVQTFRPGMIGTGLVLSAGISRLFLSMGLPANNSGFDRLDAMADQWLSTEWYELVKVGFDLKRTAKLETLSSWPIAHDLLDVCWWNTHGEKNCGRCPKCVRTMISLKAIGQLERYHTFPALRLADIIKWQGSIHELQFTQENHALARQNKKWGLFVLTGAGILAANLKLFLRQLVRTIFPGFKR